MMKKNPAALETSKKRLNIYTLFLLLSLFSGCETLSQLEQLEKELEKEQEIYVEKSKEFTPHGWNKIAILPFTGNPAFTRVSAEWLGFQLRKQNQIKILNPGLVELILKSHGIQMAEDIEGFGGTQKLGTLLNAEGLIAGNLTMKHGFFMRARLKLILVDTRTDKIVLKANFPDERLTGFSEHPHVVDVSERGAKEILKVLGYEPEEPISPSSEDF